MWDIFKNRWKQGYRTLPFPGKTQMPERFRGRPLFHPEKCVEGCKKCREICPTEAIRSETATFDLGKCLFCQECVNACPEGALTYTNDYRMSVRRREDLYLRGEEIQLAQALERKMRKLFGRSLKLREVCAGSCNGCDQELQALNNVVFDLSRFGIQFVASPRHADGLVVTGAVTENMLIALEKTYSAVAEPKIVIAVGACAISGGPFRGSLQCHDGVDSIVPVDLYIPGCPPHPLTILDGFLRLLKKIGREKGGWVKRLRHSEGDHLCPIHF